jgi:nicotinate-nucleotide--dimethylbenzimidazole phosphoribosyltransferase
MEGTPLYAEDPEEEEKPDNQIKKPENIGFFAVESGSDEPSALAKAWAETKREPEPGVQEAPKPAAGIPLPGTEIAPDTVPPSEAPSSAPEVPPPVPAEILPEPEPVAPGDIIQAEVPAPEPAAEAAPAAETIPEPETEETIPPQPEPVAEAVPAATEAADETAGEADAEQDAPAEEAQPADEIPPVPAELLAESENLPGPAAEAPAEEPPAAEEPAEPAPESVPEPPAESVAEQPAPPAVETEPVEAEPIETPAAVPEQSGGEEDAAAKPFEFSEGPVQEEELPPAPLPEAPLPEAPLPAPPEMIVSEPTQPEAPSVEETPEPPQPPQPETASETEHEERREEEAESEESGQAGAVESYAPPAEAAAVPEETRSSRAAEENLGVETAPKGPLTGRRVEVLSQAELLSIASGVNIDGNNLRHIYETHMIGERGLRRLIEEYENGGDMREALKREVLEHEIDFERDPAMRDLAPPGNPGADDHADDAGNQLIDRLLENSGGGHAAGTPGDQQNPYRPEDSHAWQSGHHGRSKVVLDTLLISVISILLLLVIFVYLSRH